jgi:hypothetical protein
MAEMGFGHADNENEVAARVRAAHHDDLQACEDAFNYLTLGFNSLPTPFGTENQRRLLTIKLVTLGYNSLRWSSELILKGYYDQSIALSRVAWEAWLHGAYLANASDQELADWNNFDLRPWPKTMRMLVAMRAYPSGNAEEADVKPTLSEDAASFKADMDAIYAQYCDFSHPGDWSTAVLLAKDENGFLLRIGGHYDFGLTLQAVNFYLTAASVLATLLVDFVEDGEAYVNAGGPVRAEVKRWNDNLSVQSSNAP